MSFLAFKISGSDSCQSTFSSLVTVGILGLRTDHGANSTRTSRGNVGVLNNLALVVANLGLGDGADGIVALAVGGWVVGRENCGDWANNGADLVVHLFRLGLVHDGIQRRAFLRIRGRGGIVLGVAGHRYRGVLVQVVVVVCLGTDHGARLAGLGKVDIGVRWRQDVVGGANDGADVLLRHVGLVSCGLVVISSRMRVEEERDRRHQSRKEGEESLISGC